MTNSQNTPDDDNLSDKTQLIIELQQQGIKHNSERILKIAKLPDNRIIFLERGDEASGLQHIINNHKAQFAQQGITEEQISDVVVSAILEGEIVDYQSPNRPIYEFVFNNMLRRIAVTVSKNGYIVCANPRSIR